MEEMQALQMRFPARLLAARRDDPEGPAWLEDGRASGLTLADIRLWWPELADDAALD